VNHVYLIAHENFIGALVMTILLVISFLLDLISFGDNWFMESIIETVLSIVEIILLIALILMIKMKRRERYIKSFNQRFSLVSNF
jgi:type VI protein secretion system component VasK